MKDKQLREALDTIDALEEELARKDAELDRYEAMVRDLAVLTDKVIARYKKG